jgi:ketosteroid isomerase-like protein
MMGAETANGADDVTERLVAEQLIARLHAARVTGDLSAMCGLFADDGRFKIAGASADKPISISAEGLAAFRPWLSMMVKVFRLYEYQSTSLIVEGARAAAHWRADIYSKVTGITVPTELIDLVEIRDGRIAAYTEFFVPR